MTAELRAEWLKLRSAPGNLWLFLAMVGLIVVVILLHGLALPAGRLSQYSAQLDVDGQGQRLGMVFGALLGAMSITTEFRHGTIRPSFLATPRRWRVVAAKALVCLVAGALFGVVAAAVASGASAAALGERGLATRLNGGDYALLLAGSGAGAALWAAIGVGIGAVVRNQVPTMVGICTWLLFVEGLLFGDIGLSEYGRFLPGALAQGAAGLNQTTLLAPRLAVPLLAVYAVVAAALGWVAAARRDVP